MLSNWQGFKSLNEREQAQLLLDVASSALERQQGFEDIRAEVQSYLALGYQILGGDLELLPQLIRFMEDPEMKGDFGAFYERVKHDERASAALDLASYACGFVCRITAAKSGYRPLPDPVLESVPEIYEYYEARAHFLNV